MMRNRKAAPNILDITAPHSSVHHNTVQFFIYFLLFVVQHIYKYNIYVMKGCYMISIIWLSIKSNYDMTKSGNHNMSPTILYYYTIANF